MKQFLIIMLLLAISACTTGGAVVFAPTPLPPEAVPSEYTHPSGAFSVLLPRTWTLYEQTTSLFAAASFAPPASDMPLVQIAVVNLGDDIALDEMGALMTRYQAQIRPDVNRYTEQERQAMGDGSWRISGVRQNPAGQTQQVNTFIQRSGSLFAVLDIAVPLDATLRSQIQTFVNTFSMSTTADLPVSELTVLSGAARAPVQIVNLSTWTTMAGVFYVTGEVTNTSETAIAELPVRVQLLTTGGESLADAVGTVMGHAIESGGFAPFSIRFGQGQPVGASRYRVSLGNETYVPDDTDIIGYPTLQWQDETQSGSDGAIFVTGTVTNTGDVDVLFPIATATLFDETGRVIGAAFADADVTQLPAGDTANFNVLISEMGARPSNYVVNVQAVPCDASCE